VTFRFHEVADYRLRPKGRQLSDQRPDASLDRVDRLSINSPLHMRLTLAASAKQCQTLDHVGLEMLRTRQAEISKVVNRPSDRWAAVVARVLSRGAPQQLSNSKQLKLLDLLEQRCPTFPRTGWGRVPRESELGR
jgi:hypothetical protein